MSEIVSDLVVACVGAAGEALATHLAAFVSSQPQLAFDKVAAALDHGYDADFDEITHPKQPIGFDHALVSEPFRSRLAPMLSRGGGPQSRTNHHIWVADEDRGVFSLFGRAPATDQWRGPRRTRASAIVQKAMRDCRHFRQAEKATTAEPSTKVTIPSPLSIAAVLLADPKSAASQIYAQAALQEWIREQTGVGSREIDLSFAGISEALNTINNRWRTSKPIICDLQQNGPTVIFLCNLFAIHGMMAMRVDLEAFSRLAIDFGGSRTSDAKVRGLRERFDAGLADLLIGTRGKTADAEFIVNPQYVDLPSAGEVLNLVDGLPLPLEGAATVFEGGIRLSPEKAIVAAISGQFGVGKTLLGLSLAASLAPLGCRTLFLSCEESSEDIQARLVEAAPRALFRSAPLFKALDEEHFRLSRFEPAPGNPDGFRGDLNVPWFLARQITLEQSDGQEPVDPAAALEAMLYDAINNASIFEPFRGQPAGVRLPHFARPVVIVDGLHQLFDLPQEHKVIESSLRKLVATCRELGAFFIFSFSKEAAELKRLEYLCDLIIELDRGGYENPSQQPRRFFQLLKARRQPARTGSHIFHLTGDAGFRIKPSLDARVQESKRKLWWGPDDRAAIYLSDDAPPGFRQSSASKNRFHILNQGQVLVVGQGSSGKAGFGLYLLHRRWFERRMFVDDDQLRLPINQDPAPPLTQAKSKTKRGAIIDAGLAVRYDVPFLETRVLVISFLYQKSYYDELTNRLTRRRGKPDRSQLQYGPLENLTQMDYTPLPDRMKTDTVELYPGMLGVEDFVAKIDKTLSNAENSGLPYTGVLVDGLHNVFVQFPALENDSAFWGMFYNILRRRRVSVVTTHTEFGIQGDYRTTGDFAVNSSPMTYDFEQAQRKIAPLLSALVSGADYLFELSPVNEGQRTVFKATPRSAIGADIGGVAYAWEKDRLRLDELPVTHHELVSPKGRGGSRSTAALSEQLAEVIGAVARSALR